MFVLNNPNRDIPPGNYFLDAQLRDGQLRWLADRCADPGCIRFGPYPAVDQVVADVWAFISANQVRGHSRNSIATVIHNITCQRLGNNRRWCYDTEAGPYVTKNPTLFPSGGCKGCGGGG